MRLRGFVITLLCCASVTVAACSGGSGPNASILGSGLRAKVVEVCANSASLHQAIGPIPLASFNPTQPDPKVLPSLAAWLAKDTDRYTTLVSDLTALGPPPNGAALWAAVLDAAKQHEAIAADQAKAAVVSDAAEFVKDYTAGAAAQAPFLAAINAAGVPECAPVDR